MWWLIAFICLTVYLGCERACDIDDNDKVASVFWVLVCLAVGIGLSILVYKTMSPGCP